MGPVGTAALGIGLNAAEGAGNLIFGEIAQRQQLRGQKQALKQQNDAAFDMWQRTNYKEQMKQMKMAGLNPGLIYGMKGGGGVTTGPSNAMLDVAKQGSGQGMAVAQQMNVNAATVENINADTEKKKAEAENLRGIERDLASANIASLQQGIEKMRSEVKTQESVQAINAIEARLKAQQEEYNTGTMDSRIEAANKTADILEQQLGILRNDKSLSDATLATNIEAASAFLAKTYSEIALNNMKVAEGGQSIAESKARVENMAAQLINNQWMIQIMGWNSDIAKKQYELDAKIRDLPESDRAALQSLMNMDPLQRMWEKPWRPKKR